MVSCHREKGQPSKNASSRSTWTRAELYSFRALLPIVMRPAHPPRGRKRFLKLHPVCSRCTDENCTPLASDLFSVRCIECVEKKRRCPRQVQFWVVSIAHMMEKPTAEVAEIYDLFGVEVRPKYGSRNSSIAEYFNLKAEDDANDACSVIQIPVSSDEDELEEEDELEGEVFRPSGSSSVFEPGLMIRDRKRPRDSQEGCETSDHQCRAAKARRTTESTDDPIHPFVTKLAICRDKLRAAGRAFMTDSDGDERAKRLLTILEEMDKIGEDYSSVV